MKKDDHLMRVEPVHASIGSFFGHKPMYRIPKYQRSYAWEPEQIEDFLQDLELCYQKRENHTPINHFFGGIVSVFSSVPGVVNQNVYELVDGQQRMATFVLLMSCVIAVYKELDAEAKSSGDAANQRIVENRISELSIRFIEFEQEVMRVTNTVEVLILSRADHPFFRDLIRQLNPTPVRDSHHKLSAAYNTILKKVKALTGTSSLVDKLDRLEIFEQLIDGDLSLIHIVTYNKHEAYTLFRVLNDRGKSLTDGDLLRARVLELLENHATQQQSAEAIWDNILADLPNVTEEYLRWVYASYQGSKPGTNTLFDDFLDKFFPEHKNATISATDANKILQTTQQLLNDIKTCKTINDGAWPFQLRSPVVQWDANRLALLVKELRITVTNPLLLAACKLTQQQFSEVVQMLERFMFRFKIIGNQHVTPLISIIHAQSLQIRLNPGAYNVNSLQTALHNLQIAKVPDAMFTNLLDSMNYKEGGNNQAIKYFLITIEHYIRWYTAGATGKPVCMDKTRLYDFTSTTIEHIYPRNAQPGNIDNNIEPLKNSLGNLTFMGPGDNGLGGNENFAFKKPLFQASSVNMNQEIGKKTQWTITEVNAWLNELKTIAVKVFDI
ncbi:DUF262 domain-containing HNH endonuclease family protein [Mucilaginibacter gossypii]|uniref:DUF262 domain-containing protein n=1 Tax=Mucilaginibacter gossypii TaxID=551996 RepID=UPI000DCB64D0|nr:MULTISPECIES: DUF262 domain-containing protein [Mucilaginibacter]QTE36377.1 DUF262 domain-containing HNH endonuclease family protein [Mucilaginibacter gossypii]RAV55873.1 DUF1524 domain-containing protein [Mucilaginibacter rubeus]